jgi:hypothetical protein
MAEVIAQLQLESPKERDRVEDLGVDGRNYCIVTVGKPEGKRSRGRLSVDGRY